MVLQTASSKLIVEAFNLTLGFRPKKFNQLNPILKNKFIFLETQNVVVQLIQHPGLLNELRLLGLEFLFNHTQSQVQFGLKSFWRLPHRLPVLLLLRHPFDCFRKFNFLMFQFMQHFEVNFELLHFEFLFEPKNLLLILQLNRISV